MSFSGAFEVTPDDVALILGRHWKQIKAARLEADRKVGLSIDETADMLFGLLDVELVAATALASSNDLDEQTAAALAEIERQFNQIDRCILTRGDVPSDAVVTSVEAAAAPRDELPPLLLDGMAVEK